MNNVAHSVTSFKGLVLWLQEKLAADLCRQVEAVLTALENQRERDESLKGWESIGQRPRTLVSLFDLEIKFQRRGYRRRLSDGTWEYRYPLDELLGLLPEERFCPLVQQLAVDLAAKTSFREAAEYLKEHLRVSVSHQEVHRWVQEAGRDRERQLRAEVKAVFEAGHVPESEGRSADGWLSRLTGSGCIYSGSV
jgi:hypothetical protein